jgi:hypothetical protein
MMRSFTKLTIIICLTITFTTAKGQNGKIDSLFRSGDTTAIMDSLLKDFDKYLDSLNKPKSFFNISLGMGTGIFSFEDKSSIMVTTEQKLIFSPMMGYYHKSGFGITGAAYMLFDKSKITTYQYALIPSFDMIKRKFSAGIAYSHYFNKDSVDFYMTPIKNEIFSYFSYKGWWVRPSVNVSYGWGSKTEYEKQQYFIYSRLLQRTQSYFVTVKNMESIRDFSVTLSVRKDIDWFDVFTKDDNFVITPVFLLNLGTQNFGFNTSYTNNQNAAIRINATPSNSEISETTDFALQSVSAVLRAGYLKGKFMLQPQIFFDYALWDTEKRFNTVYSVMVSLSF